MQTMFGQWANRRHEDVNEPAAHALASSGRIPTTKLMLKLHAPSRRTRSPSPSQNLLSAPKNDRLAAELVAVPSRGMGRCLTQQLSNRLVAERGDGVCANGSLP